MAARRGKKRLRKQSEYDAELYGQQNTLADCYNQA